MDGLCFYLGKVLFVEPCNSRLIELLEITIVVELPLNDTTNVIQQVLLQADHGNAPCTKVVADVIDLRIGEVVH